MGWQIINLYLAQAVDTAFAGTVDQAALNDGGKVACMYNRSSSPQEAQCRIITVAADGSITRGAIIDCSHSNSDTFDYGGKIFHYEADKLLIIGNNSAKMEQVILSYSGTTLTKENSTSNSFISQPATAFDYTNKRGLCFFPNGGFSNLLGFSVSGLVFTKGSDVAYSPPTGGKGTSMLGGWGHDNCYHSGVDRFVFCWHANNADGSSGEGLYMATCKVDGTDAVTDQTDPVFLHPTTRAGLTRLLYDPTSNKVLTLCQVDNARLELGMVTVDAGGGIVQVMTPKVLEPTEAESGLYYGHAIGQHPITKDILILYGFNFVSFDGGDNFRLGRVVGNDIKVSPPFDPWPASSVGTGPVCWNYDSTFGQMMLGASRSSNAYIFPGTWAETQFVDLPALTASGGEFPPVDVDITLPAFAMYQGQVCELTIDGELPALDVVSFSMSFDIVPSLFGEFGALEGSMNGGYALFGDLAPLEGSMTLYNETTAKIDGILAPLEGSMSGVVQIVGGLAGQLGALEGAMYGGASIVGELAALTGTATGSVPLTLGIRGYLPPLIGSMEAETPGRAFLDGELAPLEAALVVLEGQLPALDGRMYMSVVENTTNIAYVMNKSTGGVTRYPDYDYTFAVRWQGKEYLASPAGLFAFDQEEDTPVAIPARFTLPPSDYGETGEKRVPRVYLQGELAGQMRAGIAYDDGIERSSRVEGSAGVDKWRAKLPRGLKGHHFAVAVENVDGADFEIEQVDALVQVTGRKI